MFIDRLLDQDAAGKPKGAGVDRMVVFVVPAKNRETRESSLLVARAFTANPTALPGPYNNSLHASIQRDQSIQAPTLDAAEGRETWVLRTADGDQLELRFGYQRGRPARGRTEAKIRAAAEPDRWRIYRVSDQGVDVVRSVPRGINRLKHFELRVDLPEFRDVFDGTERLVSLAVLPWYLRQTFVP